MMKVRKLATGMVALMALGLVAAPLGAAAQEDMQTWEVTITNLTQKQALSPPIIVTHASSAHAWQVGQTASAGIEQMAEEGMTDVLRGEVAGVATDSAMGGGPLMPGSSITLMVKAKSGDVLSAATMLVQTNDGFTGLDAVALTTRDHETMAYDAGTEENDELAAHVPGPPFGGHNAGTATNPRGTITAHAGITAKADVGAEFNWSNPVARFSVRGMAKDMPGMPNTGAGDLVPLAVLALLGAGLLGSGLSLSRVRATRP